MTFRTVAAGLRQMVQLDSALVRTFTQLCIHPGYVARNYIAGRRLAFSNPITYAVLTATIYAVTLNFVTFDPQSSVAFYTKFILKLGSLVPYLILLVLGPVAGLQRWLFRHRTGYNTAECYVFLLFMYAQLFVWSTIVVLSGVYDTSVGLAVAAIVALGFLSWGLKEFHSIRIHVALATSVVVFGLSELLGMGLGIGWLIVRNKWL